MGRIKILDARGGGINKRFPLKCLPLADIEKNVRILSQKCQENVRIVRILKTKFLWTPWTVIKDVLNNMEAPD